MYKFYSLTPDNLMINSVGHNSLKWEKKTSLVWQLVKKKDKIYMQETGVHSLIAWNIWSFVIFVLSWRADIDVKIKFITTQNKIYTWRVRDTKKIVSTTGHVWPGKWQHIQYGRLL